MRCVVADLIRNPEVRPGGRHTGFKAVSTGGEFTWMFMDRYGCRVVLDEDWEDAMRRFHPLLPVSGTGTGFGPLPSRERGYCWLFWMRIVEDALRHCGLDPQSRGVMAVLLSPSP